MSNECPITRCDSLDDLVLVLAELFLLHLLLLPSLVPLLPVLVQPLLQPPQLLLTVTLLRRPQHLHLLAVVTQHTRYDVISIAWEFDLCHMLGSLHHLLHLDEKEVKSWIRELQVFIYFEQIMRTGIYYTSCML